MFLTHTRARVYCEDRCKIATRIAKDWRVCEGCGARGPERPFPIFLRTPEYEHEKRLDREFVQAHKDCRMAMFEPRDTGLECRCGPCLSDRGEAVPEPTQGRGQRRRTYVERHRRNVYERDGLICQVCFLPTDPTAGPNEDMSPVLDHIVRVADGGGDDIDNLRTAHRWCNIALEGPGIWGAESIVRARAIERFGATD